MPLPLLMSSTRPPPWGQSSADRFPPSSRDPRPLAACAPKPTARPPTGAPPSSFVTDWKAEAEHGGFYEALATGEYAKRGLDVTIIPGGPGVNVPQLMATGAADMGIGSYSFIVADMAHEGVPVKAVMAAFQHDPQMLMAHPDPALKSPADLKGDRPILVSAASTASLWPWLKATFGFGEAQRRTYSGDSAPFLADPRAVQQGYVTSEPYTVKKAGGFEPTVFLLSDYGYGGYAGMVLASDSFLAKNPAAVQAFDDASAAGWRAYLNGDPAPADALIKRDDPEMTQDVLDNARAAMKAHHLVQDGPTPVGAMSDARWRSFRDLLVKLKLAPADTDLGRAYTLQLPAEGRRGAVTAAAARPGDLPRGAAVAVHAATVTYGREPALGPMDLAVAAGERLAVVGPSGCGKSTLLRLLAGLEAPTHGTVERGALAAGETAVVFQSPTLAPWADALANVALPLRLAGVPRAQARARAAEALAAVGLAGAEGKRPAQLSGGMAMRCALARALVTRPRLMLLDEPFAALDDLVRRRLADDLLALQAKDGFTLVLVTHAVEEAAYLAERVVALTPAPGRLAAEIASPGPSPRPPAWRDDPGFRQAAGAVGRGPLPRRSRGVSRLPGVLAPLVLLALLLVAWEAACRGLALPVYVLPPPSAVAASLVSQAPQLAVAALTTLGMALAALLVAALVAWPLALLAGLSRTVESAVRPLAVTLQVTPVVAIAPLVVIWAGLAHPDRAIVALAAVVAFFPLFSGLLTGLKSADPDLERLFDLYGATPLQRLAAPAPAHRPALRAGGPEGGGGAGGDRGGGGRVRRGLRRRPRPGGPHRGGRGAAAHGLDVRRARRARRPRRSPARRGGGRRARPPQAMARTLTGEQARTP